MLSALSLLLFVAVVVLWVRSYFVAEIVRTQTKAHFYAAGSVRGGLAFVRLSTSGQPAPPLHWYEAEPPWDAIADLRANTVRRVEALGFGHFAGYPPLTSYRALVVPLWFPSLLSLMLPLLWTWTRWRTPPAPGLCPSCGYDLRATPDRCPE